VQCFEVCVVCGVNGQILEVEAKRHLPESQLTQLLAAPRMIITPQTNLPHLYDDSRVSASTQLGRTSVLSHLTTCVRGFVGRSAASRSPPTHQQRQTQYTQTLQNLPTTTTFRLLKVPRYLNFDLFKSNS
jgi:hypothetical protein